jgi:hypothetical protein
METHPVGLERNREKVGHQEKGTEQVMKKELQEAKALVEKGQIKEALDLLKSMSTQFKGAISKCPGCGESAPMLQKDSTLHGECKKCGAVWGGKPSDDLVKVGDAMSEPRKLTKKQVIAELWELYRKGDPEADAFAINSFEATGWLKKGLAVKLGLPLPEEKLEKSISEKVPVGTLISEVIRKKRFGKEGTLTKSEGEVSKNDMSHDDVIDIMLGMFKAGEESALVNRHSIAKFESTGEITDEVLKVVFRKAKKDFNELCKTVEEEEIKKFDDEDEEKHHKHMQRMIDDGSVWHFEGAMGRHAMDLMRRGKVILGPKSHKDFYGNHVPAHHEVKPGTLGSKEYQKKMQDQDMDKALKVPPKKEAPAKEAPEKAAPPVAAKPAAPKSLVSEKVGQTPPSMVAPAAQTDSKGGVSVHVHVDRGGPGVTNPAPKPAAPQVEHKPVAPAPKHEHKADPKASPPQFKKTVDLKKECGPKVKKTDKNSARGREVLPEGELKDKMKDAGEYTGPAKPVVKKADNPTDEQRKQAADILAGMEHFFNRTIPGRKEAKEKLNAQADKLFGTEKKVKKSNENVGDDPKNPPTPFTALGTGLVNALHAELHGKPGKFAAMDQAPVGLHALDQPLIEHMWNKVKAKHGKK